MRHTIDANQGSDFIGGRNGYAKLTAVLIHGSGSTVFIEGLSSKQSVVAGAGFMLKRDPAVLRALSQAFGAMAEEAAQSGHPA